MEEDLPIEHSCEVGNKGLNDFSFDVLADCKSNGMIR